MRQIPPHRLWIGHANDGRDFRAIFDAGIEAIIQVAADEPAMQPPRDLLYCRFPLADGPGNDGTLLHLTITTLAGFLAMNVPTLVCCGAGMSRSPAIAAGALAFAGGQDPDDCLRSIAAICPIDVMPGLWQEVKSFVQHSRQRSP